MRVVLQLMVCACTNQTKPLDDEDATISSSSRMFPPVCYLVLICVRVCVSVWGEQGQEVSFPVDNLYKFCRVCVATWWWWSCYTGCVFYFIYYFIMSNLNFGKLPERWWWWYSAVVDAWENKCQTLYSEYRLSFVLWYDKVVWICFCVVRHHDASFRNIFIIICWISDDLFVYLIGIFY